MSPLVLMLSSTAATVAADFSASAAARGGDCGHTCRPPPGFVEADLVAHSGPVTNGAFVQTLVVRISAPGGRELAPVLVRGQTCW